MTGSKHTPGPWAVDPTRDGSDEEFDVYPVKSGPPPIGRWAEICTVKDYHDDAAANARLISAAPDLLTAAKAVVDLFNYRGEDATDFAAHVEKLLKEAIAKTEA